MSRLLEPVDAGRVVKKWFESKRFNYYRYLIAAANVRLEVRSRFRLVKQVH